MSPGLREFALSPDPIRPARRHLNSWKEIAAFLGVTERSAQRWEKVSGLPVHRLGHGVRGRIAACTGELTSWMEAGGAGESAPPPESASRPRRIWVVGLALLLLCAGAAGMVLWRSGIPLRRPVPDTWTVSGSELTVWDAGKKVCWTKRFPPFNQKSDPQRHQFAQIADIDGDGRREVLVNFFPEDLRRYRGSLQCFDDRGRLRWEHAYGALRTFGGRTFEPNYAAHFVRPVTLQGRRYVLTVAAHFVWYPAPVELIDAATGGRVADYWHPGAIQKCLLYDIDNDGVDELIFGAVNNPGEGLGHPALGILKLPMPGAPAQPVSPQNPFPPVTGGGEWSYALFPSSDVNRTMAALPVVSELRVDDGNRIFFMTARPGDGGIVYHLDFRLNLLEFRSSDQFEPLHNLLHRQGILDHALGPRERAALGRVITFPAAPDGNSPNLKRLWAW